MSEPGTIHQDQEHLRLLAIFHFVCAGLVALCACIPLIHLTLGVMMLFAPEIFGTHNDQPPRVIGLIFVLIAGAFILLGWTLAGLLAWAGRCLLRHKAHTFCLVMAAIACLFMPLGTILGVFTIIVLIRPNVKALFNQAAPA
jgi:hypothetical protein